MAEAQLKSSRDIPGRYREYETIYILRPEVAEEQIGTLNKRVREIIEGQGGILLKVDNWGKRRLSYEVAKCLKGTYLFWSYLGRAGIVDELERNLRYSDQVIRYYTIKIAENVDAQGRASEVTDESFAKASVPAPDEEDLAVGQRFSADGDKDDDDDDDDDNDEDEGPRASASEEG